MVVRKANAGDIEKIAENRAEFLAYENGTEFSPELYNSVLIFLKEHINKDDVIIWIAENDGKLVSICVICCFERLPSCSNISGKAGYIQNVNTKSEFRRQGLATKVLTSAINEAKAKGIEAIYLGATKVGMPLYKKLGFKLLDTEMRIDL
jgi:GNAT superfamily N-acetyltransferase